MRSLVLFLFFLLCGLHLVATAPTSNGGAMTSDPPPEPEPSDPSPPETTRPRPTSSVPRTEPPPEPTSQPAPRTSSTRAPEPESESEPEPESTSTTEPISTPEPTSTSPDFDSTTPPSTITSSTWTISTSIPVTSSLSASSPTGGGQTCVQQCLAQAAANAGCKGFDDTPCICQSNSYMGNARNCFASQSCPADLVQTADQDYSTICRNPTESETATSTTDTSTPPGSTPTPSPTPQPSPTPNPITRTSTPTSRLPESTVRTVQTFVVQSGAVITVSNAVYTAGGVLTTTFSGQMGDFVGGTGVTRLGANEAIGGTSIPNSGVRLRATLAPALPVAVVSTAIGILFGGFACILT